MDVESALGENMASEKGLCGFMETRLESTFNQRMGAVPAKTHSARAACVAHSGIATFQMK